MLKLGNTAGCRSANDTPLLQVAIGIPHHLQLVVSKAFFLNIFHRYTPIDLFLCVDYSIASWLVDVLGCSACLSEARCLFLVLCFVFFGFLAGRLGALVGGGGNGDQGSCMHDLSPFGSERPVVFL